MQDDNKCRQTMSMIQKAVLAQSGRPPQVVMCGLQLDDPEALLLPTFLAARSDTASPTLSSLPDLPLLMHSPSVKCP